MSASGAAWFVALIVAMVAVGSAGVRAWEFRLGTDDRLEARQVATSAWGSVCSLGWASTTADRICKFLGWSTVASATYTALPSSAADVSIVMRSVSCPAAATAFAQCTYSTEVSGCSHADDVQLRCAGTRHGGDEPNPGTFTGTWFARLTSLNAGTLEVRPATNVSWGTVCATGFTTTSAGQLCRYMGYSGYTATSTATGSGIIWMTGLACRSTDATMTTCPKDTSAAGVATCTHTADVSLSCSGVAPTPTPAPTPSPPRAAESNVGAIVGGSIGAAVVFGIVGVCVFSACKDVAPTDTDRPYPGPPPPPYGFAAPPPPEEPPMIVGVPPSGYLRVADGVPTFASAYPPPPVDG